VPESACPISIAEEVVRATRLSVTTNLPIIGTEVNTPPCRIRHYEFAGLGAVFTTHIDAYAERHTHHSRPPVAAARAPFAATDCTVRGAISARW
jgi:hypothetical protein